MIRWTRRLAPLAALCALATATACDTSFGVASQGRNLTVLELGSTSGAWTGLDPLTNLTASINHDLFNAVYGQLFRRGNSGRIVPDLATGYSVTRRGLQVDLALRHRVAFSDGTPFNAAAVAFNLHRDLATSSGCRCLANFADVKSVGAVGRYAISLHLSRPDPLIVDAFVDSAPNWIVSPTALHRMGATDFADTPVGAGPFTVVSDQPNASLQLAANHTYWRPGYPKLDRLTFQSVADDTTAYTAMRTGQAQIYMAFGTPALLPQMRSHFSLVTVPATQTEAINLNPRRAPFHTPEAREAMYLATDAAAINAHILNGAETVSETPSGPADQYWHATVPGYRTFDPARAKTIVQHLGGLSFTLSALNTPVQVEIVEALQSQWARAGIKAKIDLISIPQAIEEADAGTLQAIATQVGYYNPALVPGLAASYSSSGPFSLVKDPTLDALIDSATHATNDARADQKYQRVYSQLSSSAYAPFLFTMNEWNVTTKTVHGLSSRAVEVNWEDVSRH